MLIFKRCGDFTSTMTSFGSNLRLMRHGITWMSSDSISSKRLLKHALKLEWKSEIFSNYFKDQTALIRLLKSCRVAIKSGKYRFYHFIVQSATIRRPPAWHGPAVSNGKYVKDDPFPTINIGNEKAPMIAHASTMMSPWLQVNWDHYCNWRSNALVCLLYVSLNYLS